LIVFIASEQVLDSYNNNIFLKYYWVAEFFEKKLSNFYKPFTISGGCLHTQEKLVEVVRTIKAQLYIVLELFTPLKNRRFLAQRKIVSFEAFLKSLAVLV